MRKTRPGGDETPRWNERAPKRDAERELPESRDAYSFYESTELVENEDLYVTDICALLRSRHDSSSTTRSYPLPR